MDNRAPGHAEDVCSSAGGDAGQRLRAVLVELVVAVQAMPYEWPGPPDAEATRLAGKGTCAGKHALLAEDLAEAGLVTNPLLIVGPLVPAAWPDLLDGGDGLLEVHECLTVETGWAGPLLVDATWPPAAITGGLSGTIGWNGEEDMVPAVSPLACYAVRRDRLREQKLALRSRLYRGDQEERRARVLAEIASRAAALQ